MNSLANNLEKEFLVIYEISRAGKEESIFAHSFIDKKQQVEPYIKGYIKALNEAAKKSGITEEVIFKRIHKIYTIKEKKEKKENAKTLQSTAN